MFIEQPMLDMITVTFDVLNKTISEYEIRAQRYEKSFSKTPFGRTSILVLIYASCSPQHVQWNK